MIKENIQSQIVDALKAHDKLRLDVLRFILSNIKYAEIEKKKDLTDEEIISLLQKEVKKRQEAIEMFKKGGRTEGIEQEENQINTIKSYLPAQLPMEDLEKIVNEKIKNTPNPQMGQVIGAVMAQVKGKVDGSTVASLVKEKLAKA
ncbi:GatB/YqeY domain-containing protein [Candidatus Gottesmanbacteria bacterium]|nr:GatB/YqeY domain-containing protein [Candidatus Gottesmanbacteria bacterium]